VLREEVNRNKCIFQYGTQQRAQDNVRHGCELVRNGYIGRLTHIDVWSPHLDRGNNTPVEPKDVPDNLDYDMWQGPASERQYTEVRVSNTGAWHIYDYALGFIAGWGAHPLDVCQWGKGADTTPPISYEGKGIVNDTGLLNTTTLWDIDCEYADGVTMNFKAAEVAQAGVMRYRDTWHGDGTTFYGTEGWVSVSRGGTYASDEKLMSRPFIKDMKRDVVTLKDTESQPRDFLDAIKDRKPTNNPVETAVDSDAISHLSDICVRTGRPIQWDPEKEEIIGDEEASTYCDRAMHGPWSLEML
jgi:predicted dehydrogenase